MALVLQSHWEELDHGLGWTLSGQQEVKRLQNALSRLSAHFKDGRLNPLRYDGTMSLGTVVATANAARKISSQVPVLGEVEKLVKRALDLVGHIPVVGGALTNPGQAQTVGAILNLVSSLAPDLTEPVDAVLNEAMDFVDKYANELAVGIEGFLVLQGGAGVPPPATPPASTSFSPVIVSPTLFRVKAAPYPTGTVARKHVSRGIYSLYAPRSTNLGAPSWWPIQSDTDPPEGMVKVGEAPDVPAGVEVVGKEDYPWYKNWKFYAALGGTAALGTGIYLLARK